jgi:hypothetical protein
MSVKMKRAKHKFHKRSREARKEFKKVKDKNLGNGLVRLTRALNQVRTLLHVMSKQLWDIDKRQK